MCHISVNLHKYGIIYIYIYIYIIYGFEKPPADLELGQFAMARQAEILSLGC